MLLTLQPAHEILAMCRQLVVVRLGYALLSCFAWFHTRPCKAVEDMMSSFCCLRWCCKHASLITAQGTAYTRTKCTYMCDAGHVKTVSMVIPSCHFNNSQQESRDKVTKCDKQSFSVRSSSKSLQTDTDTVQPKAQVSRCQVSLSDA